MENEEKVTQEINEAPEVEATETEVEVADPVVEEAPKEKGPRDFFYERIRTNFPEGKYDEDEDEYYRNANQLMEDSENSLNAIRENNEKLYRRLESDPAAAAALAEFIDGKPLPVALASYFSPEELSAQEGDEYYEDYRKAIDERSARNEEYRKMAEEINANSLISEENFKQFAEEEGLTKEQADEIYQAITRFTDATSKGLYDKDFIRLFHKGKNYDADVQEANEAGKTAGRNEKIVEKLEKPKGDGLPEPTGGKQGVEPKEKQVDPRLKFMQDLASRTNQSRWNNSK